MASYDAKKPSGFLLALQGKAKDEGDESPSGDNVEPSEEAVQHFRRLAAVLGCKVDEKEAKEGAQAVCDLVKCFDEPEEELSPEQE